MEKQHLLKQENSKQVQETLTKILSHKLPRMSTDEFEHMFNIRVSQEELQDISFLELMIRQLVVKACMGNDKSIQEILDRLIGKPVQTTESFQQNITYHDFLIQCYEQDEAKRLNIPNHSASTVAPLPAKKIVNISKSARPTSMGESARPTPSQQELLNDLL